MKKATINQKKVNEINNRINPPNKYKIVNTTLNQWDTEKQWYMCTFFAASQMLSYNCWITLTEADIEIVAERQAKKWKFFYKQGAKWEDSVEAILEYVKEKNLWEVKYYKTLDDEEVKRWVNRDYYVMIWIWVNNKFKQDVLDWKIDTKDYKDLAWNDLNHFLWLIKWKLLDNYNNNAKGRPNEYLCDINKVLQDIDKNYKFIFYNY